jgi:hypothetical protein
LSRLPWSMRGPRCLQKRTLTPDEKRCVAAPLRHWARSTHAPGMPKTSGSSRRANHGHHPPIAPHLATPRRLASNAPSRRASRRPLHESAFLALCTRSPALPTLCLPRAVQVGVVGAALPPHLPHILLEIMLMAGAAVAAAVLSATASTAAATPYPVGLPASLLAP